MYKNYLKECGPTLPALFTATMKSKLHNIFCSRLFSSVFPLVQSNSTFLLFLLFKFRRRLTNQAYGYRCLNEIKTKNEYLILPTKVENCIKMCERCGYVRCEMKIVNGIDSNLSPYLNCPRPGLTQKAFLGVTLGITGVLFLFCLVNLIKNGIGGYSFVKGRNRGLRESRASRASRAHAPHRLSAGYHHSKEPAGDHVIHNTPHDSDPEIMRHGILQTHHHHYEHHEVEDGENSSLRRSLPSILLSGGGPPSKLHERCGRWFEKVYDQEYTLLYITGIIFCVIAIAVILLYVLTHYLSTFCIFICYDIFIYIQKFVVLYMFYRL